MTHGRSTKRESKRGSHNEHLIVGEIYNLAHSPSQRWYYAPQMTNDEVLLIKGWDSLADDRARFTPHGAFQLSDTHEDAPARESIEVRTLVIVEER